MLPKTPQEDDCSSLPTPKNKKITELSREDADDIKENLRKKGDGSLQFPYSMKKVKALAAELCSQQCLE